MDWFSSGRVDEFRYMRVDRRTWREVGEVGGITGGSLDRNDLAPVKASGSLAYFAAPDIGNDLLRVYSDSYLPSTGETASVAHGTYLVSTPSSTYRGCIEEGTADLYGVLQVLAEDAFDGPLCVPAGTVAVSMAASIASGVGLPVVASPSAATLNKAAVFDDEGASKLDAVNWLLGFAGFASAGCDGYGNVLMRPYADPSHRSPTVEMRDDRGRCVFAADVVREYDAFNVPNVVTVVCSGSDGAVLAATAVNDDPMSAYSTVSRGRRIVHRETVSDVDGQDALQARADALLSAKTSAVESYGVSHVYTPMEMGEVCDFAYSKAGIYRNDIAAVSQTMLLRPGMPCTTRFRRFVRR